MRGRVVIAAVVGVFVIVVGAGPHETVCAVAACEPIGRGPFFAIIRMAEDGVSAVGAKADAHRLDLAFHPDAQRVKAFLE